jgi:hypothetical protein
LTIVQSSERYFKGFKVSITTQVGCATTHDYPTQETHQNVQRHQKQVLSKADTLAVGAFDHFVHGQHEFKRFLKFLNSDLDLKPKPPFDFLTQEDIGTLQWTDQIYIQGLEVHLYLKPDVPKIVQTKLCYDFLLSQTSRKGSDFFAPYVDDTSKNFFENELWTTVTGYFSNFQWRLEHILGYAFNHPQELSALASTDHKELPNYGYDWNRREKIKHFHARAIEKVLQGKPYGKELVDEAKALGNNNFELFFLMMMASDVQAPELKPILSMFNPDVVEHYKDLV